MAGSGGLSTASVPGWMGKARMAGKYLGPVGSVLGAGLDYSDGKAQGEDDIRAGAGATGSAAGGVIGGVLGTALGPLGTIAGSVVGSTVGGWLGDRADELVRGNAGVTGVKEQGQLQGQQPNVTNSNVIGSIDAATLSQMSGQLKARRQQDLNQNQGQNYYQQFMQM